jgi:predicted RNase H-like HicB family nuclease
MAGFQRFKGQLEQIIPVKFAGFLLYWPYRKGGIAMSTYLVTARRVGEWWALEVPGLPGVFSQAKRLECADEAAREAIAVMLGVETGSVTVDVSRVR